VTEMNLFGTMYSGNAVAPIMKQQRSGKIITVSSIAGTGPSIDGGCPLRGSEGRNRPLHAVSDAGSRAVGITANCIAPSVIATGWRIMQMVIPGSIQSNRDRAELVALRRPGTVQDFAKAVSSLRPTCPTM